ADAEQRRELRNWAVRTAAYETPGAPRRLEEIHTQRTFGSEPLRVHPVSTAPQIVKGGLHREEHPASCGSGDLLGVRDFEVVDRRTHGRDGPAFGDDRFPCADRFFDRAVADGVHAERETAFRRLVEQLEQLVSIEIEQPASFAVAITVLDSGGSRTDRAVEKDVSSEDPPAEP